MRPRLATFRPVLGFVLAAGVFALAPAPAAHAQFSYGYHSIVEYPPSQAYWNSSGFSPVYTDPTTGVTLDLQTELFRGVAPYTPPPFDQFGKTNALTYNGGKAGAVVVAPPRPLRPLGPRTRGAGAAAAGPAARKR
jgi:hypothetical protein